MNREQRIWATIAGALFFLSVLGGIWSLQRQTNDLKNAAQEAACLSIANQNIQFTNSEHRPPPLNIRLVCNGFSEAQIIAKVIHDGGIK